MPRYIATQKGFDGITIRAPGEVFEYNGEPGKWMKPFEEKEEAEAPKEHKSEEHKKGKRKNDQAID